MEHAVVAAVMEEDYMMSAFPFPRGTRVVQLYISKTKGLRAMPGVVIDPGPEVSEVKFDTGMIRFVPHKHLRKERPRIRERSRKRLLGAVR